MQDQSNNKRVAKNTIVLYIRMLITIVIGLYTSRVVLSALGFENYGIYGVTASVVAMLGFLKASLSAASSRFITYELGKGNEGNLRKTFSNAVIIHFFIAILFFIIAESVGLWFFYNKLVIPENRMNAALIVYQISILSAVFTIIQSPYNAMIIAHEQMSFYAYVEIINSVLKLLIVYLLCTMPFDKLITYSILGFIVHILIFAVYIIYNRVKYKETNLILKFDWQIARPILSYTGWDLYGGFCVTARQQGLNFVLNMFFGVVINAACSVASTVYGMITGLASNVFSAVSPQIIKQYAVGNIKAMENFMSLSIRYTIILFMAISVPALFEMNYLMNTWLGVVPEYAVQFCQISLIINVIGLCNSNFNNAIHATGNIKYLTAVTGTLFLSSVVICYLALRFLTHNPVVAYSVNAIMMLPIIIADMIIVKKQIPAVSIRRLTLDMVKTWIVCAIPSIVVFFIVSNYDESLLRLICSTSAYLIIMAIFAYLLILNQEEKNFIKSKVRTVFKFI